MDINIRQATQADALFLTSISFGVRCYGECEENDIRKWYERLNITKEYIEKNVIFVALREETIIGYCGVRYINQAEGAQLDNLSEGYCIEYLFVRPAYVKMGIGSKLVEEVKKYCKEKQSKQLNMMSDLGFKGFFEKIGAIYVKDIAINSEEKKISWYKYIIIQEEAEKEVDEVLEESREDMGPQEVQDDIKSDTDSIAITKEENLLEEKLSELDKDAEDDEFYDDGEMSYDDYDDMPYDDDEDEMYEPTEYLDEDESDEGQFDGAQSKSVDESPNKVGEYAEDRETEDENEFAEKLSYEKFLSQTVPIGYKFECEELAEGKGVSESGEDSKELEHLPQESKTQETDIIEDEKAQVEVKSAVKESKKTKKQQLSQEEGTQEKEDIPLSKANYIEIVKQLEDEEEWVAEECTSLEEKEEGIHNKLATLSKAELEVLVGPQEGVETETNQDIQFARNAKEVSSDQMISIEKQEEQKQVFDDERKKMLEGELYIAWGDDIVNDRKRARRLIKEFNSTDPEDKRLAHSVLEQLFGKLGEYAHIEPTFRCSYGYNISVGENFYASYNCIILDQAPVTIGDNCILSPQVGIYTIGYPLDVQKRVAGYQYAKPITIGDNVWIGSGAIINPGITIGDNAVIEAGTVVSFDVPENALVGGNPMHIIRQLPLQEN